jgi:hypothetical protein
LEKKEREIEIINAHSLHVSLLRAVPMVHVRSLINEMTHQQIGDMAA